MPPLSRWTNLPWEASGSDGSGHSPHYTAPPPYRSAVRTGHAHREVRDRLVHDVPNLTAAHPDLTERWKQGLCPPLQPSRNVPILRSGRGKGPDQEQAAQLAGNHPPRPGLPPIKGNDVMAVAIHLQ